MKRFLNADSYGSTGQGFTGYNMFAYCGNNPVRRIDMTGHGWLEDAWDWVCGAAEDVGEFFVELGEEAVEAVVDIVDGVVSQVEKSWEFVKDAGKLIFKASAYWCDLLGDGCSLLGYDNAASWYYKWSRFYGDIGGVKSNSNNQATTQTALQSYYPPNNGFLGEPRTITLEPGTILQRSGSLYGRYVAPAGTPLAMLSLPADKMGQPVTLLRVNCPIQVTAGFAAPWFGQIGLGMQYYLGHSVKTLINYNILEVIN